MDPHTRLKAQGPISEEPFEAWQASPSRALSTWAFVGHERQTPTVCTMGRMKGTAPHVTECIPEVDESDVAKPVMDEIS